MCAQTLPPSSDILASFMSYVAKAYSNDTLLKSASTLCRNHLEQWEAEDLVRAAGEDNDLTANMKRKIDGMNLARAGLVDEIDEWVSRNISQADEAPLHTETIGSIVDRICIAWVRVRKLVSKSDGRVGTPEARHAAAASRQLSELAVAYDLLVGEVASGRRRVPDWRLLKSYGEPKAIGTSCGGSKVSDSSMADQ